MRNDMIRFSRKQRQVLTWWRQNRWQAIICDGAVRSGKTFCMGLSFFLWAQSCFDGRQFALCGKTRMLLSIEDDEAKSEMDALLQSLEERRRSEHYVRVKALAQRLAPMGEFGRNIVTRNPEPVKRGKVFEYSHQPADLVLAMAEIQNRAERKLPPPRAAFREIVQHEPYPVESKARDILQKLKEGGITRFLLLFRGSRSRSEVVATFLAVLELCKARVLHLAGSETDCIVRQECDDVPENLTF